MAEKFVEKFIPAQPLGVGGVREIIASHFLEYQPSRIAGQIKEAVGTYDR